MIMGTVGRMDVQVGTDPWQTTWVQSTTECIVVHCHHTHKNGNWTMGERKRQIREFGKDVRGIFWHFSSLKPSHLTCITYNAINSQILAGHAQRKYAIPKLSLQVIPNDNGDGYWEQKGHVEGEKCTDLSLQNVSCPSFNLLFHEEHGQGCGRRNRTRN